MLLKKYNWQMDARPMSCDGLQDQILLNDLAPTMFLVCDKEESQDEPEQLLDKPKDQGEELTEINLATLGEEVRPVLISANISLEKKESISVSYENLRTSSH